MTAPAFEKYRRPEGTGKRSLKVAWPYQFKATAHIETLAGGIPSDPNVAKGWLDSKLRTNDELIMELVATTMIERGISEEEAVQEVSKLKHLNGFKKDDSGLYIEGRQIKAMLKEAVMIAANEGKIASKDWGNPDNRNYLKGIKGWFPEHVHVLENRVHLGVDKPSGVMQRFVHTHRGTGIQYEEYVDDAKIEFTVITDHDFTEEQWAMIFLTGEQQGIGASRSQGYGKFTITDWEKLSA